MNNAILWPMGVYLILVFALAFYSRHQEKKQEQGNFLSEYLIGNRSLGGMMLAMTLAATYASASSFIGGPSAAYKMGLGWVLLAMIQLPAAWLTLSVLGKKFAIEARRHHALTLNDMLYAKYKNRAVVIFASLALLLAFFATMVVQFIGGARLIETVTGLSYQHGLLLFSLTVGLYTCIGGFRAVVITDTLQGFMMIIGTIALLVGVIYTGGGIGEIITRLHQIDPALVSPYGPNNVLSQSYVLSFWVLICFGVIGLPHAAVRCMSYKSSRSLHTGIIISTAVMGVLMLGMHLAGAFGRAILPDIQVADHIMPTLMITVLPPLVAGIFLAGPMAAIMSTIDSLLIQASATLLNDLYLNYIKDQPTKKPKDDRKLAQLSRWTTGIFSLLVFLAALNPPEMIIWVNLLAFGAMQTIFLWPLILGLYWKKACATGALISMFTGISAYGFLSMTQPEIYGIHAIVPSLFISLICFVLTSSWRYQRHYSSSALG